MHLGCWNVHLKDLSSTFALTVMKYLSPRICAVLIVAASISAWPQTCQTRDDIPEQARATIENAALQTVTQVIHADVNSLRASIAPSQQANANGMLGSVNDNKAAIESSHPQLRTSFLLDTGATPSPDGRFFCGIFGAAGMTANGAEFDLPG